MISLRLWRSLRRPPWWHPLYWWANTRHQHRFTLPAILQVRYDKSRVHNIRAGLLLLFGLLALCAIPVFLGLVLIPLLMIATGPLMGLICALQVSRVIQQEHTNGSYDLLCLTPPGQLLVNWALCTGSLHRNRWFIVVFEAAAVLWALALPIFVIFPWSLGGGTRLNFDAGYRLIYFYWCFLLVGSIVYDYVQSVVLGCLCALQVGSQESSRPDQQFEVTRAYLLPKLISYAAALLLPELIGLLLTRLLPQDLLYGFILPTLRAAILLIGQETVIHLTLQQVVKITQAMPQELTVITLQEKI